jgi:hypothetical protein
MANINTPFTTQDGFSSTTSTVDKLVFGDNTVQITAATNFDLNTVTNQLLFTTSSVQFNSVEFGDTTVQNTAWTGTVAAVNVTGLATVATSGQYSDLTGSPTALSSFTNDVGFITSSSAVTSIIAGSNITVNTSTGAVTITATPFSGNVINANSSTLYIEVDSTSTSYPVGAAARLFMPLNALISGPSVSDGFGNYTTNYVNDPLNSIDNGAFGTLSITNGALDFGSGHTGPFTGGPYSYVMWTADQANVDTIGSGPYTIDTWAYMPSSAAVAGFQGIVSNNGYGDQIWGVDGSIGSQTLTYTNNQGSTRYPGTTTLPQNQWVHIAFMCSGASGDLWGAVNGVPEYICNAASNNWITASGSCIGANLWGNSFNGLLRDIRISSGIIFSTNTNFTPPVGTVGLATWTFSASNLKFPDGTEQTTAAIPFNTSTLVANAVNAEVAAYATTFNTSTLVATAVDVINGYDISTVTNQALFTTSSVQFGNFTATGIVVLDGLTYPATDGSAGQVLSTDGAGNLSWATSSGTPGATNVYARDALPAGSTGTLITISDSGSDTNSPAGNWAPAYWDSDNDVWTYIGNSNSVTPASPPPSGPPISGYIGWYDVTSFTGSTWDDLSGNAYHATVTGSPTVSSVSGSGGGTFNAILGSNSDTIMWPMNMPTNLTLFIVSRYNGSNQQRIVQGYAPGNWSWLFGHHDHKAGVVYYGGALNSPWIDRAGSNWLISSCQNSPSLGLYHGNGVDYPVNTGSQAYPASSYPLNINSKGDEASDFAITEIILYDTTLSSGDISSTEAYLAAKYGITI